jgi:hypothetical protein
MVWRGRLKSKAFKYDVEDIVKKIKVAYGLIRDIKGYHIRVCSSSNSSIEETYNDHVIGNFVCVVWRGRLK